MADGSNITHLRPPLRIVETGPAGRFEFAEDRPRVDIEGGRVFLFGRLYKAFVSETNAARCAAALMTLDALDALPGQPEPPRAA